MLTVNFVLMTICVTMTGTPRQSVTIFQVLLSQINTKPPLSSQLPDPSQGREEDNVEVATTLQELRNDHVPIIPGGGGGGGGGHVTLINVVILSSILSLTGLIKVLISQCSDV